MKCDKCPCPRYCNSRPIHCEWAARDPVNPMEIKHICHGKPAKFPSLQVRAANLVIALRKWAKAGFRVANTREYNRRRAICLACPLLVNDACSVCGCSATLKPYLHTEKCPKGKWEITAHPESPTRIPSSDPAAQSM